LIIFTYHNHSKVREDEVVTARNKQNREFKECSVLRGFNLTNKESDTGVYFAVRFRTHSTRFNLHMIRSKLIKSSTYKLWAGIAQSV
jgi:hypothetical protein